jgi:hypothetical protein
MDVNHHRVNQFIYRPTDAVQFQQQTGALDDERASRIRHDSG